MAKVKYKFNPSSLSFERIRLSLRDYFFTALRYLFAGVVFAVIAVVLFLSFFKDPRLRTAERENKFLSSQLEHHNQELDTIYSILTDLQRKDDEVYRSIFGAKPYPEHLRKSGVGGSSRYQNLKGYESSEAIIETQKRISRLQRTMVAQSKSLEEVFELAKKQGQMLQSIPAIQPVNNKDLTRIASGFGMRIHPIYKLMKMHTGLDFTATVGTEIYATGDGVIQSTESKLSGYGLHVIISHGYGYETLYGHMSRIVVRPGEKVKRGQLIGYVGSTGTSSGPHVHYEVIKDGEKVNPAYYFFNDITIAQYEDLLQRAENATQSLD
ncbi:MAG: M23 family metallopeptidase [Flavobacteriales bacterium]|nr:M23 family metallopeptidase [Flavobacteriales bacterium]